VRITKGSRIYEFQGERLNIAEIARRLGIREGTLWARLNRMTSERAFSMKLRARRDQ
jgi:DNA-directed RNA polymerase specialized sigma24 family protein